MRWKNREVRQIQVVDVSSYPIFNIESVSHTSSLAQISTIVVSGTICNVSARCSSASVEMVRLNVFHGMGTISLVLLLPVTSSLGRKMHDTWVTGPLCDSNFLNGCLLLTSHTIQSPSSEADINKVASKESDNEFTVPLVTRNKTFASNIHHHSI